MEFVVCPYKGEYVYPYPSGCLLLTTGGKFEGEGNFSGWYASEWMSGVTVYGVALPDCSQLYVFKTLRKEDRINITTRYQQSRYNVNTVYDLADVLKLEHVEVLEC